MSIPPLLSDFLILAMIPFIMYLSHFFKRVLKGGRIYLRAKGLVWDKKSGKLTTKNRTIVELQKENKL